MRRFRERHPVVAGVVAVVVAVLAVAAILAALSPRHVPPGPRGEHPSRVSPPSAHPVDAAG